MIPRDILFNFKKKKVILQVIINTENSRKEFLLEIDFELRDLVLLTSWITELPYQKKDHSKKKSQLKELRERQEIYKIQGEIIKNGLYYCLVEVKKPKFQAKYLA